MMGKDFLKGLSAGLALAIASAAVGQASASVVITQLAVRGPVGGNDEFIELGNTGASAVDIGGWALQGCASGTPGTASNRAVIPAGVVLQPGAFYLFTNSASGGYSLGVTGDQTYATGFTDFGTTNFAGVRIIDSSGVVRDGVGAPLSPCREGNGITTPTTNGVNTAFFRRVVAGVVQDVNDNASDFPGPATAGTPRNNASGGITLPTVGLSLSPASFSEVGGSTVVTATLSAASTQAVTVNLTYTGSATSGVDYTASSASISIAAGSTSGSVTINAVDDTAFEGDETVIVSLGTVTNANVGAPNSVTATIVDNDPPPPPVIGARIYQIQGNRHLSPMSGQSVTGVPGIVTALASNGFYMQDGDGDGDVNTSDGILVFTSTAPTVSVGQEVTVNGNVSEFRPNGAAGLTVTEIVSPTVTVYPAGNLFTNNSITPTILGIGGRSIPTDIIDNDSNGNVETSPTNVFDPSEDGIDFYETVEGMLVQINDPVLTSPTLAGTAAGDRQYFVLADNGVNATGRSARGGVTLVERSTGVDYNPERIELFTGLPNTNAPVGTVFNVGDKLAGPIFGVMSYFGNYEVLPTAAPVVTQVNPVVPTVTSIARGGDRLTVATFNIENYDPNDPVTRRNAIAAEIVTNMHAPDIISLGEVQDNNGATNTGIVAADVTLQTLIDAIVAAGGPTYTYAEIDPVNNQDGGEPGGNIRVVQLYNPTRVTYVPGLNGAGDSTTPTSVSLVDGKLVLSLSPGRVDPTNSAWSSSRKPLAVTYDFNGRRVLVIGNHFNSKGGDQSLYGVNQPPVLSSETQRRLQTQIVHDFVYNAQQLDPNARIVVLGDLNDFDFSNPLRILRNGALGPNGEEGTQPALINLGTALVADPAERYSYVFDGNSQELDHILASPALFNTSSPQYQVAHVNAEYGDQASDHDPIVSSYLLPPNATPVAVATATPADATPGASVVLDGSASHDADGTIASYAWTQTGGSLVSLVNANSAQASFVAPTDAAGTLSFELKVTDNDGASGTTTVSVNVNDVTPDAFSFTAVTGVETGSTQTSNTITVTGITTGVPISVSNGSYSINGGSFVTAVGTVKAGDTVAVQIVASSNFSATIAATVTIGGVSADYKVTTRVANTTPTPFSFSPVSGAAAGAQVVSNSIVVLGIDAPAAISIVGGEYSINNGAFTSLVGAVVNNGDTVRVRVTASTTPGGVVSAVLTIDTVSAGFAVTTAIASDTTPDAFSFPSKTNVFPLTIQTSAPITVTGINAPAPISIQGGAYSVNGGPYTLAAGTVKNGDVVRVRTIAPLLFNRTNTATLTIGGVRGTFSVSTIRLFALL
jgi:predicted extracellular nuclease